MFASSAPLVLDGGLATELERRGYSLAGGLWSARALLDAPELLSAVHASYVAAGADLITTASYQLSREALERAGLSGAEAPGFFARSLRLAQEAALASPRAPRALLSLGPFGAFRADRSEYHGDYGVGAELILDHWRRRLSDALPAAADGLAFETVPSLAEAELIARALEEAGAPLGQAMLCFSAKDERHTSAGDPIGAAISTVFAAGFGAVGINCTSPARALALAEEARRSAPTARLALYPGAGAGWAAEALEAGVAIVGGCCGTGPELTAELRQAVDGARGPNR